MGDGPVPVTATLVGYYGVCPREAWLMGHALSPFPDHELLALGRLLQETAYREARKEVALPGMRLDLLSKGKDAWVVAEVKRGSGQREAHLLQLGYYLLRLEALGLKVQGELRYPEERRAERVNLTPELRARVQEADLNKRFLEFAAQKGILLHFFNRFGYYVGSLKCCPKFGPPQERGQGV
ncbi:CRISPR-associated protein Cas4 [Thermus thermophilus]|uniref:CRISPR-associated protein Cas4 n=1 Tax=Thermus thermophilus TaxID=274 RepID=A0A7R7TFF4_THETH|nr:CRISPR-associated protein Cas4 [Thermus thermophilus]BCP67186.1 CRISPR-associated protein Cas4 [Thermus thermophilus]